MAWMILLAVFGVAVVWLRCVEAADARAVKSALLSEQWTTPESLLRDDRHGG